MPHMPLVNEVLPGFETPPQWTGLLGPGGLPPAIVKRLFTDVVRHHLARRPRQGAGSRLRAHGQRGAGGIRRADPATAGTGCADREDRGNTEARLSASAQSLRPNSAARGGYISTLYKIAG